MGRKPNPLILEHFERGAKLLDSSNRYEHTCKHCGDKFPKGRIDGLQTHLIKKCPALSLQDRQKAALEINNLPSIPNGVQGHDIAQMNGPTVALPIGTGNWTALETLAEVSRQVNLSENHDDRSVNNRSAGGHSRASEPPRGDRLELQELYTSDHPPVAYEQRALRDKKHIRQKVNRQRNEASASQPVYQNQMVHSRSTTPNLAIAATSMAAAAAAARFQPSMVDPQLLGDNVNRPEHMGIKTLEQQLSEANPFLSESFTTDQGPPDQELTWPMIDGSGMNNGSRMNSAEMNNDSSMSNDGPQMNSAPQVPRMTNDPGLNSNNNAGMNNNAEVHNSLFVEEQGPEQPPNMTAAEPAKPREFARIAMNPTMTTTEFTTEFGNGEKAQKPKVRGRFKPDRRKEVQRVRKLGACIRCRMLKKPCSPETPCSTCRGVEQARLWKVPCVRTRLAEDLEVYSAGLHSVLAYRDISRAKTQGVFHNSPHALEFSQYPQTGIFATFNALIGQDINVSGTNIDPGLSGDFSTKTSRLLDSDNDDVSMKIEAYMKRMSPTFYQAEPSDFMRITLTTAQDLVSENNDMLLMRALELWSFVHILVDCELKWTITERISIDAAPGQGPIIDRETSNGNYDLLVLQLNAATEKKASVVCKSLLDALERRLLKKQESETFETFLVAIILLNCIEKSTWLFKSWEQANFNSRWPLDKSASHFSQQGDRLTLMLSMLLKMRGVLPKVYTRAEDGVVACDEEGVVKGYFERVGLSYNDVLNAQANHVFDSSNSRCYELRFCSDLILQNKNTD